MQIINLDEYAQFREDRYNLRLLHDSPGWRIINFNFEAGQELPVHSHDVESEVMILVLAGEGYFTGGESEVEVRPGSMLISKVSEPHGIKATTRMRVLVAIAPPI
ncbi:MAG TPA: cupin domain-containing protein [Euryarchaeota archaeon]|nr:cupin domain protein [archaeon BMS3Bbin15]HDL14726.1 cupin domain-containing protein [Euryarchaeota archaeon]